MRSDARNAFVSIFSAAAGAALVLACSASKPPLSTGATDGSFEPNDAHATTPKGDGFAIPTSDADLCASESIEGPVVSIEARAGDAPAPAGGAIAAGKYLLTAAIDYGVASDASTKGARGWLQAVLFVTDTTLRFIEAGGAFGADGGTGPVEPYASGQTYTTNGVYLITRGVCPDDEVSGVTYSVIGDELHLFDPPQSEAIYTRQL